jgi:hypothetical protein
MSRSHSVEKVTPKGDFFDRMNPLTVKIVRRLFFNSLFIKNIIFKILKLIRNDYNVDIVMIQANKEKNL